MQVNASTARLGDQVTLGDGEVVEIVGIVPSFRDLKTEGHWVYFGRDDQAWASEFYHLGETFEVTR